MENDNMMLYFDFLFLIWYKSINYTRNNNNILWPNRVFHSSPKLVVEGSKLGQCGTILAFQLTARPARSANNKLFCEELYYSLISASK